MGQRLGEPPQCAARLQESVVDLLPTLGGQWIGVEGRRLAAVGDQLEDSFIDRLRINAADGETV